MSEQPTTQPIEAQGELSPLASMVDAIKSQPGYQTETVAGIYTFNPAEEMVQGAQNSAVGVEQGLHAVLLAGEDAFGVVKIDGYDPGTRQPTDGYEVFALTHFKPGERPEIIGTFAEGSAPLRVGRTFQPDLSSTVSRNHFSIGLTQGKLTIEGRGQNGTEIIRPMTSSEVQAPKDLGSFGFDSVSKFRQAEAGQVPANPLADFNTWSAASKEAKQALQDGEPLVKFVESSKEDEDLPIGTGNPNVIKGMVDIAGEKAVSLDDILSETEGKSLSLTLQTGDGKIVLDHDLGKIFQVVESDDAGMKVGQQVLLDGATIGGSFTKPNVIAPQTRLAYKGGRSARIKVGQPGQEDSNDVYSPETIAKFENSTDEFTRRMIRRISDNEVEFRYFDTSPRMTEYLTAASATIADDEGVSQKQLF